MLKHKNINKICWAVVALVVVITILFTVLASSGLIEASAGVDYEDKLFDTSKVHSIDIAMDDWEGFLETATTEQYSSCTITIDGEKYADVGIRGKGNTSLSQVEAYDNDRYSFKVEFDQYNSGGSYYGLDKLSLNNIIQDNTYMKDYLSYQMMNYMGIAAPLCSYAYITVNGEDWGLYLAVESVEDGFLQRNYGTDYGELYKPDSMNMGGGRGNGKDFDIDDFTNQDGDENNNNSNGNQNTPPDGFNQPSESGENGEMPDSSQDNQSENKFPNKGGNMGGGGFGGMGQSDVMLQYTDDNFDSYSNIFDNAKTNITDADKNRLIQSLKKLSENDSVEDVVDIDNVIKYFVVHDFVQNGDSYTGNMIHNYYLYEEDGVLSMIPWDYNLAFGGFSMGGMGGGTNGNSSDASSTVNAPIDTPVTSGTLESRPMVAWIFENEEYTALYHQYYQEFMDNYFNSGYFEQMIDETIALISPYVGKDPTAFCTYDEFLTGSQTLKDFCLLRAESVCGQLDGTIPSTQDGQSEDSSSFIDASDINISDMGAMGGGFGKTNGNMPNMSDKSSDGNSDANGNFNKNDFDNNQSIDTNGKSF